MRCAEIILIVFLGTSLRYIANVIFLTAGLCCAEKSWFLLFVLPHFITEVKLRAAGDVQKAKLDPECLTCLRWRGCSTALGLMVRSPPGSCCF